MFAGFDLRVRRSMLYVEGERIQGSFELFKMCRWNIIISIEKGELFGEYAWANDW